MREDKLYYQDPYLVAFDSTVIECIPKGNLYTVILEKTAFYPEGGGQSYDIGYIDNAKVLEVHTVDGKVVHTTDTSLTPGEKCHGAIDWERRFSHMQHHTAEHIVSGIIHKFYGADNVGFHLGTEFVTMDYNVNLNDSDIEKIELLSNEAVYKNLPVKIDYYDSVPPIGYRSKIEIEGEIRIVTVEDYDVCACCGTQTKTTGEIGTIKIIDFHKYKGGTRLYMLCGDKAIKDYQLKQNNIKSISALLSVKPESSFTAVQNLLEEKNSLKQEISRLKMSLHRLKAEAIEPSSKVILFMEDYSMEDLIKFGGIIKEKAPLIALFSGKDDEGYKYCVYSEDNDIKALASKINSALNGKGGGREFISGNMNSLKKDIEEFFESL